MAKAKAPSPRKFTLADKRTLKLENRSLPLTIVVALFAAIISFVALRWVGVESGMHPWFIAPLLPLTIDGLGIICSLGIIRSASAGEPWRKRASEWVGLFLALSLSMLGNAVHALGYVPDWLKIVNAVAVPAIVAYSIHVLGRYLDSGLSTRVYADDPDKVHADVWQVGDLDAQPGQRAPRRAPQPSPTRATPAREAVAAARQDAPTDTPAAALATRVSGDKARVRALVFDLMPREHDPVTAKLDAAAIQRDLGLDAPGGPNKATVRAWVRAFEDEWRAQNPDAMTDPLDAERAPVARTA